MHFRYPATLFILFPMLVCCFVVIMGCGKEKSAAGTLPSPPDASKEGAVSRIFKGKTDEPVDPSVVVAVRWSLVLFEGRGAVEKAFPDRTLYEVLPASKTGDGFQFTMTPPPADRHVFAGACAGFGGEACTGERFKRMEANPRYAVGVLVLIQSDAATCTFARLAAEDKACENIRPVAVSRHLILYVYEAFSPAEDDFLSRKWPWQLPGKMTPGFHVVDFEDKSKAQLVTVDILDFTVEQEMPNLF